MKKTILQMALFSLLTVLAAGVATADRIGVLLQDSDGSSGGYATTLKLPSGDWSVTGGVATVPTYSDNETLINRLIAEGASDNETIESLIQQSHADNNATNSETRSDQSVTPASLAYWSQNALTTRLMAWLADGTITSIVIGDGNFTVDSSGNVTAKSYSTTRGDAAQYIELYEATSDGDSKATIAVPAKGTGLAGDVSITVSQSLALTGTMNDGKYCTYASSGNVIACNSTPAGTGDFLADGSVPMTDGIVLADGNGDAPTTDGEMKYDRTAEKLQVGDGAATKEFVPVGVSSMITKYQYFPAAWMEDNATTPCAAAAVISGEETKARLCDDNESVIVGWQVDPEWTAGFKYRVYYGVVANAEENDTVTWRLSGCSVGNSDALSCTAGDQVSISDELGTDDDANELEITGWSNAVTITNLAAGEWARLTLMRGTDDEATEVNLIGIEIKYQAKVSAASDY